MYCRKCGKMVRDKQEYCDSCTQEMGNKESFDTLNETVDLDAPKSACPFCGKMTDESKAFCEHCDGYIGKGKKIQPKPPLKKIPPKNEDANKKVCKACSSRIPTSAIYCPNCKKLADTAPVRDYYGGGGSYWGGFFLSFFVSSSSSDLERTSSSFIGATL